MKTTKKLIAALIIAPILTLFINIHPMSETTQEAAAQEVAQLTALEQQQLNKKLIENIQLRFEHGVLTTIIKGADVNVKSNINSSALEWACLKKNDIIAHWLIMSGADTTCPKKYFPHFTHKIILSETERYNVILCPLRALKKVLRTKLIEPYVSVQSLITIIADYAIPYYKTNQKTDLISSGYLKQRTPDYFLNTLVTREWTRIKKELNISKKRKRSTNEATTS